jgi:A/G-specific adenine glycosylase
MLAARKRKRTSTPSALPADHSARRTQSDGEKGATAAALLDWYDRHRRVLPWRALPGVGADPYRVWLSEIMLQQTTVKAVVPYYSRFLALWPDVGSLARAPLDDVLKAWAGLGYYARARNLHACARAVVDRFGGVFPDSESDLLTLPGIGSYTAGAVAAIAFNRAAVAVDGNVERVIARLHAVEERLPGAKPVIRMHTQALLAPDRPGDFVQALMDLGATICTPKNPACALCPWSDSCVARERGDIETFPRKTAKKEGALRRGAAFVAIRADGMILLRQRPAKGLLGGMTEVPTTAWDKDFDLRKAAREAPPLDCPAPIRWRCRPGVVMHVFTHFPLELTIYTATVPAQTPTPEGMRWALLSEVQGEALPSVMRKVIAHALPKDIEV